MKHRIYSRIALIFMVSLFAGCATTFTPQQLDEDTAYLAGYFKVFDHRITFRELNTGEDINLTFKSGNRLSIIAIPPGVYTPIKIDGYKKMRDYSADIPLYMMTVLNVIPGEIIFIGDIKYNRASMLNLLADGFVAAQYPFDQFREDIQLLYPAANLELRSLELMPFVY